MNRARRAGALQGASLARLLVLVVVMVLLGLCPGLGAAANAEVAHETAVVATVAAIVLRSVTGRRSVVTPGVATPCRPVGQVPSRVAPHLASSRHPAPRRGPPRPVVRRLLGA